jgi:hypothetical protein
MKFTTLIALILLSSVERTLNFEDFVHACMAKIAIDSSNNKVKNLTNAVAFNLGNKDMFKDFSFEGLKYYEIANYPDKAKDKVKKDKTSNQKKEDNKEVKKDADKKNDKEKEENKLYTEDLLRGKVELSQEVLDDQLRSRRKKHCLENNLNQFIAVEPKYFDCYYDFHFSTDFVDPQMNRINLNGNTKSADIKTGINDKTLDTNNFNYWIAIPSLWGYLSKTLDDINKSTTIRYIDSLDVKTTFDVTYLIHVLGDLHQPIHSINIRDTKYFPSYKGDKSANDIKIGKVKLTKDGKTTEFNSEAKMFDIHHLWDDMFEPNSKVSESIPYSNEETTKFSSFCDSLAAEYNLLKKETTPFTYELAKEQIKKSLKESFEIAKKYAYESIKWADNVQAFKGYKVSGDLLFSNPVETYKREYTVSEEAYKALKDHILKGTKLIQQILDLISEKFELAKPKRKLK